MQPQRRQARRKAVSVYPERGASTTQRSGYGESMACLFSARRPRPPGCSRRVATQILPAARGVRGTQPEGGHRRRLRRCPLRRNPS